MNSYKRVTFQLKNTLLLIVLLLSIIGTIYIFYPDTSIIKYSNTSSSTSSNYTIKPDNHNVEFNSNNSILNNDSTQKIDEKLLNSTSIVDFTNVTSHSSYQATGTNIAVDSFGNFYVIGSMTFSPFSIERTLIAKFMPNGTQVWNKTSLENYTNILDQQAAIDSYNDLYVLISGIIYVQTSVTTSKSIDEIILAKYDPNGNLLWNQVYMMSSKVFVLANSMALDNSTINIVFTTYSGNNNNRTIILIKLTTSGNIIWKESFLDSYINNPISITNFNNSLFLTSKHYTLKINDTNGAIEWNTTHIFGNTLAIDNSGNIYSANDTTIQKWIANGTLVWIFKSTNVIKMIYNNEQLYAISKNNYFNYSLLAINSLNGSLIWKKAISSSNSTIIWPISFTVDVSNNIYVVYSGGYSTITFLNETAPCFSVIIWNSSGKNLYINNFGQRSLLDYESKAVSDNYGNIYTLAIVVDSETSTNWLITLSKRDKYGDLLWDQPIGTINGLSIEINLLYAEIQIDSQNNIYTLLPNYLDINDTNSQLGNQVYSIPNFLFTKWNSTTGLSLWNYSYYTTTKVKNLLGISYLSVIEQGPLSYTFHVDSHGNSYIFDTDYYPLQLMKINENGHLLWNKSFNVQNNLNLLSYKIFIDPTYVLISYTTSTEFNMNDSLTLLKLDSQNNLILNETTPLNDTIFVITSLSSDDQGYIYILGNREYSSSYYGIMELKYNQTGFLLFEKTVNIGSYITTSAIDPKGSSFILTITPINNFESIESQLIVLDNEGNIYLIKNFMNVFCTNMYLNQANDISIAGFIVSQIEPNNKIVLNIINYESISITNLYRAHNIFFSSKTPFIDPILPISLPIGPTTTSSTLNDFDYTVLLAGLIVLFLLIFVFIGSIIFYKRRKDQPELSTTSQPNEDTRQDISKENIDLYIIEQILIESYHAPDYDTVLHIQQGDFPDYESYNQALKVGITNYQEWIKYKKKNT